MYHGFTDKQNHEGIENYQGKHVHIEKFREQVKFLKKNYNVISLDRVVRHLTKGEEIPPWSVALSLDDGYRSNYSLAYPVLRQHGVPATIFLTTDFVEQRAWLWPDRVEYAINKNKASAASLDSETKRSLENKFRLELKKIPQELRGQRVENIERQQGTHLSADSPIPEIYQPLSWSQVSEMTREGFVSIGSHTHTHVILNRCNDETLKRELEVSKEIIERKTGENCRLFCYPNGEAGDFDERTKAALKAAGYHSALTTMPGFNQKKSDVFELKRFGVRDQMDLAEFAMSLCGVKKFFSDLKQFMTTTRREGSDSKKQEKLIVTTFDQEAPTYYNGYFANTSLAHSFTIRRQRVYELLENLHRGAVLDIGCGPGVMVDHLTSKGLSFYGVDPSLEMIKECRKKFAHLPSAHFSVGQAERLEYPDSSFDAVISMGVLEYLPDELKALKEMARVVKPGSPVLVTFPNQSSPYRIWDRWVYRGPYDALSDGAKKLKGQKVDKRLSHKEYTESQCSQLLQDAGLKVKDCVFYNFKLSFAPLDVLFPGLTVRISRSLEPLCRNSWRWLGTGFIMKAVKH